MRGKYKLSTDEIDNSYHVYDMIHMSLESESNYVFAKLKMIAGSEP